MAELYTYLYPISDSGFFFRKTIKAIMKVDEGLQINFTLYNRYADPMTIPISINDEIIIHGTIVNKPKKTMKKKIFSEYVIDEQTNTKMYGYDNDHYVDFNGYEKKQFSYFIKTDLTAEIIDLHEFMLPEDHRYGLYRIRFMVKENKFDSIHLKKRYTRFSYYEPEEDWEREAELVNEKAPPVTTAVCPCCKKEVGSGEVQRTLKREIEIIGGSAKPEMKHLAAGYYHWACDACLNSGKAVMANHENFSGIYGIYLAFYDIEKTCKSCKKKYIFTKEEQVQWFEKLQFCHRAKSVRCKPCLKKIRYQKSLQKKLSALLAIKKDYTAEQLKEIITIYLEMGKPEKTNRYSNLLKKHLKNKS